MLRSERMESLAIFVDGKEIKDTFIELGNAQIIQIKKTNKMENVSLKNVERVEQMLKYLKTTTFENRSKEMSFKEVSGDISLLYKKMVELNHSEKNMKLKKQEQEEIYVMAREGYHFIEEFNRGNAINFISAITEEDKKFLMKKLLKTALKRNVYVKLVDVDMKYNVKKKCVLIIYVHGEDAKRRAIEVVETMGGHVLKNEMRNNSDNEKENKKGNSNTKVETNCYNTVESILELKNKVREINAQHKDIKAEIKHMKESVSVNYKSWLITINKERKIYEGINCLKPNKPVTFENVDEIENVFYTGEAWVKEKEYEKLKIRSKFSGTKKFYCEKIKVKEDEKIPTSFETNIFTEAFQNITNVFGVPRYREINPAIFMIFTFPFMFGAMFGDVCHGLILFFISTYMISKYDKLNHNCGVLQILLNGRFIILLCSISSLYFGFLYGDFAGQPIKLFTSQFESGRTYPFGIDHTWHHAENEMTFTNSIKMKLSLILGFMHMTLGSSIDLINAYVEKDLVGFYLCSLPQFIAFTLFLGYLVFLCVYKWLITIDHPSLVETLIGMYTDPFNMENQMYSGQLYVQLFILLVILLAVPIMFFGKPLYVLYVQKKDTNALDLWINTGIHTIEFGLGLISNTSSYLRLWAVSLAHVQLTSVLHQFTIGSGGFWYKVCIFPVYFAATMLLLIGLEGLSSCLHALRLNWIEFFGKFYKGGGECFEPLQFEMSYEDVFDE